MNRIFLVCIILFGFSISSFSQDYESRKVGYYDEIKVSHGIEVVLVKGTPGTVKIRSNGIDLDDIETRVEWETLKIRFRNISIWDEEKYDRRDVTIEVPFSELNMINAGTGALIKSRSVIKGDELRVQAGTGAELYLEMDVQMLRADISMGAIFEASGLAVNLRLKVNMGAEVDLGKLDSDFVTVKAGMGGEVSLCAFKEIDASASMGGQITIYGGPEKRYTSDSFGGVINFRKVN